MSVDVTANNSVIERVCGIRESVLDQSGERRFLCSARSTSLGQTGF